MDISIYKIHGKTSGVNSASKDADNDRTTIPWSQALYEVKYSFVLML